MSAQMSICERDILCVDCDNNACWFAGKTISDCPKYKCDRPSHLVEQCDNCTFIKKFQKEQREFYKQKGSIKNDME